MKKFKYPISVRLTKEQSRQLIPKLKDLGYRYYSSEIEEESAVLVNNCFSEMGELARTSRPLDYGRYEIKDYNEELVLALAAAVDDDQPHVGEWVVVGRSFGIRRAGELYKIIEIVGEEGGFNLTGHMDIDNYCDTGLVESGHGSSRKATKEEIINHFSVTSFKIPNHPPNNSWIPKKGQWVVNDKTGAVVRILNINGEHIDFDAAKTSFGEIGIGYGFATIDELRPAIGEELPKEVLEEIKEQVFDFSSDTFTWQIQDRTRKEATIFMTPVTFKKRKK